MRADDLFPQPASTADNFIGMMQDFLPLAMKYLNIKSLPKFQLIDKLTDGDQPSFGRFVEEENTIYLGMDNRHPVDICRTLAHELVHFKQGVEHQLDATSGHTGSPQENQAHELAGIMMREFGKQFPEYFDADAIVVPN